MAKTIDFPVKPPKAPLHIERTTLAQVAATALINAFDWSKHPWGADYWKGVHRELERLAEIATSQQGPSK